MLPPACGRSPIASSSGSSEFLTPELARWAAFDPDLREPMAEIRRLVLLGRQAAAAGVLSLGVRRLRRRPRRPDRHRRRRRIRADARLRPVPRRRDGRRRQPARRAHHARRVRRPPRRWRLGRRGAPVRRGDGDPDRRPRVRLLRSADGRRQPDRVADLERAADRAQRRSGARHARIGARASRRRPGRADLPLQVGQVHDRAPAPPRCGAGRARPSSTASARD